MVVTGRVDPGRRKSMITGESRMLMRWWTLCLWRETMSLPERRQGSMNLWKGREVLWEKGNRVRPTRCYMGEGNR